jgi:hypothetical protein
MAAAVHLLAEHGALHHVVVDVLVPHRLLRARCAHGRHTIRLPLNLQRIWNQSVPGRRGQVAHISTKSRFHGQDSTAVEPERERSAHFPRVPQMAVAKP